MLAGLASQNRAEALALLNAIRQARSVTEEEDFCERGREKALKLMQQQQIRQAADLLRNLRSLFFGLIPFWSETCWRRKMRSIRFPLRLCRRPSLRMRTSLAKPGKWKFRCRRLRLAHCRSSQILPRMAGGCWFAFLRRCRMRRLAGTVLLVMVAAGLGWKLVSFTTSAPYGLVRSEQTAAEPLPAASTGSEAIPAGDATTGDQQTPRVSPRQRHRHSQRRLQCIRRRWLPAPPRGSCGRLFRPPRNR